MSGVKLPPIEQRAGTQPTLPTGTVVVKNADTGSTVSVYNDRALTSLLSSAGATTVTQGKVAGYAASGVDVAYTVTPANPSQPVQTLDPIPLVSSSVEARTVPAYACAVQQVAADRMRIFQSLGSERFWGIDLWQNTTLPGAVAATGNTTNLSNQITSVSKTNIANGDAISGAGIPVGATVLSGGGTATLTISANATATATGVALTINHRVNQLGRAQVYEPFLTIGTADTKTGAGWSARNVNALASGGGYYFTTTAGEKGAYTIPAGATKVGIRTVAASNAGIVKVLIGGDATRANRLPTAQQLVTQGRLASLGALSATDRVLDLYSNASDSSTALDADRHFIVADGTGLGGLTIEVVATASQNFQSSSNRAYLSDRWLTYATAATTRGSAGAQLLTTIRLLSRYDSAYEYAHELDPTGTNPVFIGNVHGYESQQALTLQIDGRTVTPAVGEMWWGDRVDLSRDTTLYHPNVGSGDTQVATVRTYYTVSRAGLDVVHRTTWLSSGTLKRDYPMMFPMDGPLFASGQLIGSATVYPLNNDNGIYYGQQVADGGFTYGTDSVVSGGLLLTATLAVIDKALSVDNFALSAPLNVSIEDRVPLNANIGSTSKIYITRVGTSTSGLAVVSGVVQFSSGRYTLTAA